jgi:HSP20 family protein
MNYLTIRRNGNWNPLTDFRLEMDQFFNDILSPQLATSWRDLDKVWSPSYDIAEEDDHYLLSLEMPGVPKDAVKIELIGNVLSISGERRNKAKKANNEAQSYRKFHHSITLPVGADRDKIEARHEDGILQIVIPKAEAVKPREIKISTSNSGFFSKLLGDNRKTDEHTSDAAKPESVVA